MKKNTETPAIQLLLAEDDKDDRFFFKKALNQLKYKVNLVMAEDGAQLMAYLKKKGTVLPDVLFLDLNMPCKNGAECLVEIKNDPKLKDIPVIIYSTSVHDDVADILYQNGAHYYVRKTDIDDLVLTLKKILGLIEKKLFVRPERKGFVLNILELH
jgi:CheY-like chemotaxis protein